MAKKKKSKKSTVKVDFSGVRVRKLIPEADYPVAIDTVTKERNEDDTADYFNWVLSVAKGPHKGNELFYNTSLQTNSLWNLRGVMEAFGMDVPEKAEFDVDKKGVVTELAEYDGIAIATVEHDSWQGKKRNSVVDIMSTEVAGEDDDDDDKPEPPNTKELKKMKEDDLEKVIDDLDLDVDLDEIKGIKKKRQAVIDAIEGDDDDDSDGEDTESDSNEDDEDEDEGEDEDEDDDDSYSQDEVMSMKKKALVALVEKHDLDVELTGKIKTDRKLVVEALDDEDLLEDEDDDD